MSPHERIHTQGHRLSIVSLITKCSMFSESNSSDKFGFQVLVAKL
jgi:hypothetical protein